MIDTTISENTAGGGGLDGSGGGLAKTGTRILTNCTISANGRGGILNYAGTLTMVNCTISGKTFFGGVTNSATLSLTNCTISNNTNSAAVSAAGGVTNEFTAQARNYYRG